MLTQTPSLCQVGLELTDEPLPEVHLMLRLQAMSYLAKSTRILGEQLIEQFYLF